VHALVPSAIADSVRTLRRRKLHRQAAGALETLSPEDYEPLAYHYGEAGDEEQALKYYTRAGERAAVAFVNLDAENHFQAALDLVEEEREEADLLTQLGIAQTHQGKNREAQETWRQAIEIYTSLNEKDIVAELFARSARSAWDGGDTIGDLEICRQGLAAVDGTPAGPGLARLLAETSRAFYFNGLHEESGEYGQQALQMAENLNLTPIQVETLTTLGTLSQHSSKKSIELLKRAVELAESSNLHRQACRAHNNLSIQYVFVDLDFPKALYHMQRAVDLEKQIGDLEFELFSRVNIGMWLLLQGNLKAVAEMLPALQELNDSLLDPGSGGTALKQLHSTLLTYQGFFDQAFETIHQRMIDEREAGDLQRLVNVYKLTAQISLITGDIERGKQASKELIGLAEKGMTRKQIAYSYLSRVYSRKEEIKNAQSLLEQAIDESQNSGQSDFDQLFILWAQAELKVAEKNWDDAWMTYERLIDLGTKYGFLWHSNRVRVDWATALLARGEPNDKEKARQLLETAISEDRKMGADGFVQMAAEQLANIK
jgi:tetratricopeptide (TPR) repeat protein